MFVRRLTSRIRWSAASAPRRLAKILSTRALASSVGLACALAACTTYRDNLSRGERLYQEENYQESLALCRLMERDVDALSRSEQARYAYLRGMVDYRLGFKSDARHWLGIAQAIHEHEVGGLDGEALATAKATLDELNREVYGLVPIDTESKATEHGEAPPSSTAAPEAAPPEPKSCSVDADCASQQICVAERCTEP